MMKTELFQNNLMLKDIPGYEGLYAITSTGEIWSYLVNRWISIRANNCGYMVARLCNNGKKRIHMVHRLVWQAYNGPISKGLQINHIDENKLNNDISNLEICDGKYNVNYGSRPQRARESLIKANGKPITFKDESGNVYSFASYSQANKALCPDKGKGYFRLMFFRRKDGVFSLNGNKYFYA